MAPGYNPDRKVGENLFLKKKKIVYNYLKIM